MTALIAAALLLVGSVFCVVAAVGMLRLPDTLMRMHAATKAGTLGAGCILAAEAVMTADLGTTLKVAAVIVFLLLTAPVGAHLIGRAAYHRGIRLFEKTWIDELGDAMQRAPNGGQDADPIHTREPDGPGS